LTRPRPKAITTLAALSALLLAARIVPADSEDVLPAGWAGLARTADVIVAGECAAERSSWDQGSGVIVTTIEFRPQRFYKGEPARVLTIKTLGGRVGDESMAASHGASLAGGEQVLLFLKRSEFGDYFVVAGGEAGKLRLDALPEQSGGPTAATLAELARLLNRNTMP
jgi:hypothetical protein